VALSEPVGFLLRRRSERVSEEKPIIVAKR
jgi:hypothetical protein